eukprot:11446776-Ditylum_brightwellii.AAC.1
MKDGNMVLLNESIDGISYKVKYNKSLTLAYFYDKKTYLSFPITNHTAKNCRDQMVSCMSVSSIGYFIVDPWVLKMMGVSKELYCTEDWESDAVVLHLASPKPVSCLMD